MQQIEAELGNNHNWWASLDYISYLKNLDAANSPVYYNFTDTDINSLTVVPGSTISDILDNHREGLAEEFIQKSDYTFLVYYRNAAFVNHFISLNNISGKMTPHNLKYCCSSHTRAFQRLQSSFDQRVALQNICG